MLKFVALLFSTERKRAVSLGLLLAYFLGRCRRERKQMSKMGRTQERNKVTEADGRDREEKEDGEGVRGYASEEEYEYKGKERWKDLEMDRKRTPKVLLSVA